VLFIDLLFFRNGRSAVCFSADNSGRLRLSIAQSLFIMPAIILEFVNPKQPIYIRKGEDHVE